SGIHQDGVLKERTTYEIMDATTVGLDSNAIVLGKHSGRHALRKALEEMGFKLDGQALNMAFKRFKEIADRKKLLTAMDLEALVADELREEISGFGLDWFEVEASSRPPPHARVSVTLPDGASAEGSFTGDGPIDAVFQAIDAATGVGAKLSDFRIGAVTEGQDALGEVSVVVDVDGHAGSGQGVSTDIIDAAARAYVRALSVAVARSRAGESIGLPEAAAGWPVCAWPWPCVCDSVRLYGDRGTHLGRARRGRSAVRGGARCPREGAARVLVAVVARSGAAQRRERADALAGRARRDEPNAGGGR